MTDDVRSKIEFAPQRERGALNEWVERVVTALGHEGALVTDESMVSDFLRIPLDSIAHSGRTRSLVPENPIT